MTRKGGLTITKYGTIKGGGCDKAHDMRRGREEGSASALRYLKENDLLTCNNGWWRVKENPKLPKFGTDAYWEIFCFGGDHEIGFLRFTQEIVPMLVRDKKPFRWKWIERWADDIASFEFGISGNSPIPTPEDPITTGFCPPHADHIYQEKKKDGVL